MWKRCSKEKPELKCSRWTPFRASSFIPSSIYSSRSGTQPTADAVFVWLLTSRDGYMVIWWYAWLHVSLVMGRIQSDGIIWDTKSKDSRGLEFYQAWSHFYTFCLTPPRSRIQRFWDPTLHTLRKFLQVDSFLEGRGYTPPQTQIQKFCKRLLICEPFGIRVNEDTYF